MHSVQEGTWDPQSPSKHGSPLPPHAPSHPRFTHLRSATPAKRITFYKSGDSRFGGVKMAIHKRSFKCFDALLDDLSQKVPLPFGVRTVTTPHGTTKIKHLEQLQDGACYLCSDRRQAKPIDMDLATKRQNIWYHNNRRSQRPDSVSSTPPGHLPHRQRRILLLRNTEPWTRRTVVLSRKLTRSLRAFLDEVSQVMQFHVRKLYTTDGRKIDSVQSLMTYQGVLVCVGREPFSPTVVNFLKKSSEEKLPGLGSKSPGLGPRTPGNGARSPPHGAQSGASEYSEGPDSKKNVNFGLETKKSIIHPRSDSSNRSARFSLSSEKSYVNSLNARPAIMNDDIEKRVLVNKDGSVSVEMKVRFRLVGEESLQWSTLIKKTPTLNSDCSLNQNQSSYLQHTQSGSCSDPDSVSFGPDGGDEVNHSHCCYHRPERHYDLWENPVHSQKQHPAPPPYTSSRTIIRHTRSSSSSSSCNSRRVVRCRAQLTNSERTSQLVQEEMCVTKQISSVSHSEVVVVDGNPSSASFENEVIKKEDECARSGVSSCSQVLQLLKDDDDEEDLPPSASQCSHRNEAISPTENDNEPQNRSEVSAASNRATDNKRPDSHASLKGDSVAHSVVSWQSGTSAICSNCGGCKRGVKHSSSHSPVVSPKSDGHNSRSVSRKSDSEPSGPGERHATGPTSVPSRQSCTSGKSCCEDNGMNEEGERSQSATSAKSHLSAISCMSLKSNCSGKAKTEERSISPLSAKSSHKSCHSNIVSQGVEDREANKSPQSCLSVVCDNDAPTKSNVSVKSQSNCSRCSHRSSPDVTENEEIETLGRPTSAVSAKSNLSAKSKNSCKSVKAQPDYERDEGKRTNGRNSSTSVISNNSNHNNGNASATRVPSCAEDEEQTLDDPTPSHMSVKSNKSRNNENLDTAVSPTSFKSRSFVKSSKSRKTDNRNLGSATPTSNVISIPTPAVFDEDGNETTNRPPRTRSNISEKSNVSLAASKKSNNDGVTSEAEDLGDNVQEDCVLGKLCELLTPTKSVSSVLSVKSTKSSRSKCGCGTSSGHDKTKMEAELGQDENNVDSESDGDFQEATPSQKGRRESGGTDLPVSQNSFGSVSLGLPEDQETADSDIKSNVSSHKRESPTPNQDVDRIGSVVSRKSQKNDSKSPFVNGHPTIIPTIETPAADENEDCKENVTQRAWSAVSLASSKSHKSSCRSNEKTGSSADEKTVEIKVDAKNRVKSPQSAKAGREAKNQVNGVDEDDSVHSKCSGSLKLTSHDKVNSSAKTLNRGKTPNSSAPSAGDDLNEVEEDSARQSRKSNVSRAKSGCNKSGRNQKDLYEPPEVDLSPACLPNASPSEVVSNWLRGIPADSSMIEIGDELNENEPMMAAENHEEKNLTEEEINVCSKEAVGHEEEPDHEGDCAVEKEKNGSSPGEDVAERVTEEESRDSLSKNWQSSATVMKVLLSSSLGRCQSMPEVSPVYGRRLSTSAKGLLDCLTQLQLIEPAASQAYDQRKGCTQNYEDIMVILQSLWLTEPREGKDVSTDQVSPPRSSSGVGMSSGSGASGKENETSPKEEESLPGKKERVDKMESGAFSESLETKDTTVNRTEVSECLNNQLTSHKLHTEKGPDFVSESASTVPRPLLSKKLSQDPDPVWILHLLKKLEKQFMNHYTEAMAEFKVRWDLDDSLILDKMITELKQEVRHRVQSSIDREMKKIQGRAGKSHRPPRPPEEKNLSRDSSMTEKRRRMLKVMKNQSAKTADSLSDGETTADLSDQRSEDEYCPCDACLRKKMEARPFQVNPMAADAPVQMEFDLLKILQLKKATEPASPPASLSSENGCDAMVGSEEGRNLCVVEEEEEEEGEVVEEEESKEQESETKDDIVADLVLEETIPEEDEGEATDVATEKEKNIEQEDEEQADEETTSGEEEQCQCQCDNHGVSNEEDMGDREEEETEECGEEVVNNNGKESTHGEECVEGDQSSSAKDEDEADDDTEEGETEEQKKQADQAMEDKADAEDSDTNKRRPSDTSIEASQPSERDNQGDGDDEEGETDDAIGDLKPNKEEVEETLPHQFTRTSVESQPGSLEEPDVDSDPAKTLGGSRKASGGSVGGAALRRSRSPGGIHRCKPEDSDDEN